MEKIVLMGLCTALLVSACSATGVRTPWVRSGGQPFTYEQLSTDQDYCRQEALRQIPRETVDRGPGPRYAERRQVLFRCMEEKGWLWQKEQSRESLSPRRSYY